MSECVCVHIRDFRPLCISPCPCTFFSLLSFSLSLYIFSLSLHLTKHSSVYSVAQLLSFMALLFFLAFACISLLNVIIHVVNYLFLSYYSNTPSLTLGSRPERYSGRRRGYWFSCRYVHRTVGGAVYRFHIRFYICYWI